MRVLVIVAHPDRSSFNHAIAQTCADTLADLGHEVVFHDLYEERFNPLLPCGELERHAALPEAVQRHCDELANADGVIIVHPNWWGQPPAILKGWIDRVVRPGTAHEFVGDDKGEGVPRGLLKARAAIVFNTSNTEEHREQAVFGDPLETIWRNCIFALCGIGVVQRRMFSVVVASDEGQRRQWLDEVADIVAKQYPKTQCQ